MSQANRVEKMPEPALPANDERRAAPRYSAALQVRCYPVIEGGSKPWQARARNVSPLGIGLVLPRPIDISTLLEIGFEGRQGGLVRNVLARVFFVQADRRESFIGCAFVSELAHEELLMLQAAAVHPGEADGRPWVRFPCNV